MMAEIIIKSGRNVYRVLKTKSPVLGKKEDEAV
jgi:hypothetical protein